MLSPTLTEKDCRLQISFLESIGSTQIYLKELLRENKITSPCAVVAQQQTNGLGSRGNAWHGIKGNLFLSFAYPRCMMPQDLKIESSSIYFAYLLKETLAEAGSKVWLKWPNDFYLGELKIGGVITNVVQENLLCGIGLNLQSAPEGFAKLDIEIKREKLLESYFIKVEKFISWKQVFSKYELEFFRNQNFFTHGNGTRIPLKDVSLQSDGSIISNGERIFSLR